MYLVLFTSGLWPLWLCKETPDKPVLIKGLSNKFKSTFLTHILNVLFAEWILTTIALQWKALIKVCKASFVPSIFVCHVALGVNLPCKPRGRLQESDLKLAEITHFYPSYCYRIKNTSKRTSTSFEFLSDIPPETLSIYLLPCFNEMVPDYRSVSVTHPWGRWWSLSPGCAPSARPPAQPAGRCTPSPDSTCCAPAGSTCPAARER